MHTQASVNSVLQLYSSKLFLSSSEYFVVHFKTFFIPQFNHFCQVLVKVFFFVVQNYYSVSNQVTGI